MTIRELIEKYYRTVGRPAAVGAIMQATGKAEPTIRRWINHGFPTHHAVVTVALLCGASKEDAIRMAAEEMRDRAA